MNMQEKNQLLKLHVPQKIRRPNKITNKCSNPLYPFKKLNKHNIYCCYKNNSKN